MKIIPICVLGRVTEAAVTVRILGGIDTGIKPPLVNFRIGQIKNVKALTVLHMCAVIIFQSIVRVLFQLSTSKSFQGDP